VTAKGTREIMMKYINSKHSDVSMMADDVVFTNMATGEEHHGREGVLKMLQYVYHVAFEADAETRNMIFTEDNAVLEADFVGQHIGEFAGIQPTNKNVRVPLCVVYDLEHGQIKRGRVYFEMPVLMRQIEASIPPKGK
jgi:steroid delta-isomerase-like uncharacterized protein